MLILDSHVTHTKNLAAADMAREAGVAKVSLPPHTTHRFQPLDGAFSDRLGNTDALSMWMRERVGRQHSKSPTFLMWRTENRHPFRMLLVAPGRQVCGQRPYTYSKTPTSSYHIRIPRLGPF